MVDRARGAARRRSCGALGPAPELARAGLAIGALGTALVADIWRSETVPGANDNLSGVAGLVGLAELLREQPVPGLRVLLVSCGAEETLQDGIRAFVARHRDELDPARTAFVNLDTVGSPHLVLLEARGAGADGALLGAVAARAVRDARRAARRSRCGAASAHAPRPTA